MVVSVAENRGRRGQEPAISRTGRCGKGPHPCSHPARRVKTRILRVTWLDGKETKTVVWENGKVLDSTILPWYWRVFRWVFITEKKAEKK